MFVFGYSFVVSRASSSSTSISIQVLRPYLGDFTGIVVAVIM